MPKKSNERNFLLTYGLSFATALVAYLIRIFFAKNLSVYNYGLFYAALTLAISLSIFRDFGMSEAMIFYINKFLVKKDNKRVNETLKTSLFVQTITATIIAVVLFALSDKIARYYLKNPSAKDLVILVVVIFVIKTFYDVAKYSLVALQKFTTSNFLELLLKISILISALFFLKKDPHIFPALAYITAYSIISVFAWAVSLKNYPRVKISPKLNINYTKEMLSYSIQILFSTGAGMILSYSDIILLTILKGATYVSFYNIALPSFAIILLFLHPFSSVLFPVISKRYHKKDKEGIEKLLGLIYNNILMISLPLSLIFVVFAPTIIKILFGVKYLEAANALRILSAFFIFTSIRDLNFPIIAGIGKPQERSKIMYCGAVFNIIMDLILIPKFGISGAALATGMGYTLMAYLSHKIISEKYNIKINVVGQGYIILSSLMMFFVMKTAIRFIKFRLIFKIALVLLLGFSAYLITLKIFNVVNLKKIKLMIKFFKGDFYE